MPMAVCHGQTVIQFLEAFAPKHLAVPDDRIGLQVGTLEKPVRRVMIALDVLEPVVDEAIAKGVDLIIAHHAPIFRPLTALRTDLPQGRLLAKLIRHDIAVYVAHTNLDVAPGGINDLMAERLGLLDTEVLDPLYEEKLKKIVVFVPKTHHRQVLDAMAEAGAGWIGNYSHCTFNVEGTGTFLPREGANPFIGQPGKLETVEEIRLETIVPEPLLKRVIQAMLKAHPYEEVAFDVYPVENAGRVYGLGRMGKLPEPLSLRALAEKVKEAFAVSAVRVVGDLDRQVETVAVLGGDGNKFVAKAARRGADVLITGDVYYHTAHDALALGLALIDPGHNVERIVKDALRARLAEELRRAGYATEVIASELSTDPFRFV
ncbi:Nif3-like dinuclear metal center hexameric protein [Calditerricola satsumensis]|uniref:GTP cyclohydrolase 1 type 2 homolog n=2 Tax=Calditerricola satsumensis TaxID=373054 RepID=A0A8J3FB28_9BACI|nr:GTP cyclohydrolase 1 type 2 [Calditerricola satsumensis]